MRLFHLLRSHDTNARTGVPRFSGYFQKAFPETIQITPKALPEWEDGDVCVTDNELSLMVPERIPTIPVHHGNAIWHYMVDSAWQNPTTERMATQQRLMFHAKNRLFVAPSRWVDDKFRELVPKQHDSVVIPHWVPLIAHEGSNNPKKVVIGDFRNHNKGMDSINAIRVATSEVEFRQLDFDGKEAREAFYRNADAYLCLSLSEGAPYSVADAEAASLPIISTQVGNCYEFEPEMIADREDVADVVTCIELALAEPRTKPSFYQDFTFESWQAAWRVVIDAVQQR